jgi:hypothetical protein
MQDLEARIECLEKKFETLENLVKKQIKKERKENSEPRKLSEFQLFMQKTIKEIKVETPQISHKDAFNEATKRWKTRND